MVQIYAPASIGNVSVGFDVLGAALAPIDGSLLGDTVSVAASENGTFTLEVNGRYAAKLPVEPQQNILFSCVQAFNQRLAEQDLPSQAICMTLHKALPIGSGLGSSAASIVAAFHALNDFYQSPFTEQQLLTMMGELEGQISGSVHYDNVAPCFLGGLQLMPDFPDCISLTVPSPKEWYWVVAYPGISVSTAEARRILPTEYSRQDLILHSRLLATFIHAMHTDNVTLARQALRDVVAEPYRRKLLPGFDDIRDQVMATGALAMGISGSGPTVFVVADTLAAAQQMQQILNQHYLCNEDGFSHICRIDPRGSRRLTAAEEQAIS